MGLQRRVSHEPLPDKVACKRVLPIPGGFHGLHEAPRVSLEDNVLDHARRLLGVVGAVPLATVLASGARPEVVPLIDVAIDVVGVLVAKVDAMGGFSVTGTSEAADAGDGDDERVDVEGAVAAEERVVNVAGAAEMDEGFVAAILGIEVSDFEIDEGVVEPAEKGVRKAVEG